VVKKRKQFRLKEQRLNRYVKHEVYAQTVTESSRPPFTSGKERFG